MITEKDLQEAIAECQGQRNPNANTCIKLAAYYTILDHISEKPKDETYQNDLHYNIEETHSFGTGPSMIDYSGDTEFAQLIQGKDPADIWPIMDELMSTIQILYPKLYSSVLTKL